MKEQVVLMLVKNLYPMIRPILRRAINRPEDDWDDYLMNVLDKLMDYKVDILGNPKE